MSKTMIHRRASIIKLVGIGLLLMSGGFIMLSVEAQNTDQPTRVPSLFDPPQQPAVTEEAFNPIATTSPITTTAITPSTTATNIQPTRIQSIFDAPQQQSPTDTAPIQDDQPTRVPSIFDAPQQPADTAPTTVPSIFDTPPQAPATDGQVPSIFDAMPQTPPTDPFSGATGGVPSIFDTVTEDVIRYTGYGQPDRAYCLSCHANQFLQMSLPSGEIISVAVDEDEYLASIHGQHGTDGYRCIRCHVGMNEYPHPEVTAQTARELTIELSTSCARCHTGQYHQALDNIHAIQLASGNLNSATCSDCHGSHTIQPFRDRDTWERLDDANQTSVAMCSSCHIEVYERYAMSVHGSALLQGSQDVPTCADCHGTHNTQGAVDNAFRLFSPQICADCHADTELMAKYDISTDVFDTYVADFHGTTVMIFQSTSPDQPFNSPVCSDCHGVHNIMAMDDLASPAMKENLVITCQRCHPSATTNFPDAWLSHYPPSFERTPLVALAQAIYMVLIPMVIGGLGIFVASDVRRRRRSQGEKEN